MLDVSHLASLWHIECQIHQPWVFDLRPSKTPLLAMKRHIFPPTDSKVINVKVKPALFGNSFSQRLEKLLSLVLPGLKASSSDHAGDF